MPSKGALNAVCALKLCRNGSRACSLSVLVVSSSPIMFSVHHHGEFTFQFCRHMLQNRTHTHTHTHTHAMPYFLVYVLHSCKSPMAVECTHSAPAHSNTSYCLQNSRIECQKTLYALVVDWHRGGWVGVCGCVRTKNTGRWGKTEKRAFETHVCKLPTFDGYKFSFLESYLDSIPRISISSALCRQNSTGTILRKSWMMERNLVQLCSSFWLMRLPVVWYVCRESQTGTRQSIHPAPPNIPPMAWGETHQQFHHICYARLYMMNHTEINTEITCTVDWDFNVGAGIYQSYHKQAHGDCLAKSPPRKLTYPRSWFLNTNVAQGKGSWCPQETLVLGDIILQGGSNTHRFGQSDVQNPRWIYECVNQCFSPDSSANTPHAPVLRMGSSDLLTCCGFAVWNEDDKQVKIPQIFSSLPQDIQEVLGDSLFTLLSFLQRARPLVIIHV